MSGYGVSIDAIYALVRKGSCNELFCSSGSVSHDNQANCRPELRQPSSTVAVSISLNHSGVSQIDDWCGISKGERPSVRSAAYWTVHADSFVRTHDESLDADRQEVQDYVSSNAECCERIWGVRRL